MLGVTLAEAALLLVFVLLLSLVFRDRRSQAELALARERLEEFSGKSSVEDERLEQLELAEAQLAEVKRELDVGAEIPPDDFRELVRAIAASKPAGESVALVEKARQAVSQLESTRAEMRRILEGNRGKEANQIVESLSAAQFQLANQRGQIVRLQEDLDRAGVGKGLEFPSCWTGPDGSIDYLLDVSLMDNGLLVQEASPQARSAERQLLPMPLFPGDELVAPADFLARTSEIFSLSQRMKCRFFVRIRDRTGTEMKSRYKDLLRAVEAHFYKLLLEV